MTIIAAVDFKSLLRRVVYFFRATILSGGVIRTMASKQYRLVAGLGNPGRRYERTRHNIGFMVVDQLSSAYDIPLNGRKFKADYGLGRIGEIDVLLVKPMAYMNNSGPPLQQIASYFKVACEDIVVVHDDLDLGWETVKIKISGGHGGHNGLRSIIRALGTGDFKRIRVGIGRGSEGIDTTDFVLGKFGKSDQKFLGAVINRAVDAVVTVLSRGPQVAMNLFHGQNKR